MPEPRENRENMTSGETIEKETQENPENLMNRLRQTRDELKLQQHLFGAEVKDRWHEMEHKWDEFYSEMNPAKQATRKAMKDINQAQKLWLAEIARGYREIRNSIRKH